MIFLDHNATTPICPEALEAMCSAAQQCPGNPGSRHSAGRQARRLLEDRREEFASLVDANPDEVVFTSGGTESSNLAIHGLTAGRQGAIALPQGEHPASEEPVRRRIKEGCRRLTLPLDPQGHLVDEALDELDFSDVILAASLLAHNETGTIRDLNRLSEMCREQNIPFHVDAVQAVGKIPVSFHELGATTMSIGAHKFHGPRGIGVLLVKRRTRLIPLMRGGHQEHGLRPGTEPVALVAGMTAALRAWSQTQSNRTATLIQLRDRLQCRLSDLCSPVVINGDPDHRLPNTLHMAFPGCEADALLVAFDLEGICCSLGSACASGSTEPSPILLAMGLSPEVYNSSVRLSLGIQNTLQEMDETAPEPDASGRFAEQ
ncbi:MAG: cysteine desulfurase, partial [Planctomycetaceae bacterium]|nr:cysteine desulfurase [Planctomycetaceae bacterium]